MRAVALRSVVLASVVAVALSACGAPAVPLAANYATVTGTVVDSANGAPIAGAVVTVDSVLTSAPTGPDGSFRITNVPNGTFDYSAAAPGYRAMSTQLSGNVDPGGTATITISLTK